MYTWNGLGIVVIEPSGEKKEKFIRDFKACKNHCAPTPILESKPDWRPVGGVMTDMSKIILSCYHSLTYCGERWDDTMRRAVVTAKYKESRKWSKLS